MTVTKCSQIGCEAEACCSYIWPGRMDRLFACVIHAEKAAAIANAMGFCLGDLRQEPPSQKE